MLERIRSGLLDGRAVELREVSAGIGIMANKTGDGFESMMLVLVHSAHWADSGERIFKDRASIDNEWPMRLLPEIIALASVSGELNLPQAADVVETTATNGTGVAHPSH